MTTATSQGEAHEVAKENKKAIQARNLRKIGRAHV